LLDIVGGSILVSRRNNMTNWQVQEVARKWTDIPGVLCVGEKVRSLEEEGSDKGRGGQVQVGRGIENSGFEAWLPHFCVTLDTLLT
jgi:hypothetical protein